jgi:hypothetical protein
MKAHFMSVMIESLFKSFIIFLSMSTSRAVVECQERLVESPQQKNK